jgi:lysophospholipase L1-like esterase
VTRSIRLAAAIALAGTLAATPSAQTSRWVTSWAASPQPPMTAGGPIPATPTFSNQTIRQVVRVSAGGSRLRLRISNEYGTAPLAVGAVRVAAAAADGAEQPGTSRRVTFGGQSSTVVPAGAPAISDPVDLATKPLASLSVSLYLPEEGGVCSCHGTALQTAFVSGKGDFSAAPFTTAQTIQARAYLTAVDVEAGAGAKAVVVFGDSISDGVGSTVDANRRWPDRLAERLAARGGAPWGVVNAGISGNRVLSDGMGQSALARFDRDVLAVPGAAAVIVFMGVNDVGLSYGAFEGPLAELFKTMVGPRKATAADLIAAYQQLIARAHGSGLKIYGATIAPYEGAAYYSMPGETVRSAVNQWMRTSKAFDAVLDFDAVFRDPAHPTRMLPAYDSGDHLHGSDAGYDAVAKSVDLSLFR